ncbi:saccharopine dehydrogenase NADP-binding domain-containing protein [Clostridiaceae bacterium M8S5]|nr:saccharopine dehydrogenase NADP-binding domain-containing protein [Clostridiaceae bacterium M8S5]
MIGIIGGYGDIGLNTARILKNSFGEKLRIGGRNIEAVSRKIKEEFKDDEWIKIDIENENSLDEFIKGVDVALNCAGTTNGYTDKLYKVLNKYKCNYVDVGYSKEFERLKGINESSFIYGAGSSPGLSGILPRYLSKQFDKVTDMNYYYGVLDIFTKVAARDYLDGIKDTENRSMVVLKEGEYTAYIPKENTEIFPLSVRDVTVFPYIDKEAKTIIKKLKINNARFNMVVDGENALRVLEKARRDYNKDKEKLITDLCTATKIDCQGRKKYAGFVIEMSGVKSNEYITKTLIVKANTQGELTGLSSAVASKLVKEEILQKGVISLGEIDQTNEIMNYIIKSKAVELEILDGSINELFTKVEGEL